MTIDAGWQGGDLKESKDAKLFRLLLLHIDFHGSARFIVACALSPRQTASPSSSDVIECRIG